MAVKVGVCILGEGGSRLFCRERCSGEGEKVPAALPPQAPAPPAAAAAAAAAAAGAAGALAAAAATRLMAPLAPLEFRLQKLGPLLREGNDRVEGDTEPPEVGEEGGETPATLAPRERERKLGGVGGKDCEE
jgi:hypothetical protein